MLGLGIVPRDGLHCIDVIGTAAAELVFYAKHALFP